VIACGRRSGKSEIPGKRYAAYMALNPLKRLPPFDNLKDPYTIYIGGPTHKQTKKIYWQDMLNLIPEQFRLCKPDYTNLIIKTIFGHEIIITGLDTLRTEGDSADLWIITEADDVKNIQDTVARIEPMLANRGGRIILEGTPNPSSAIMYNTAVKMHQDPEAFYNGYGNFCEDEETLKAILSNGGPLFHWISEDILDPIAIAQAKANNDPITYLIEYCARFISYGDTAYYNFSRRDNVDQHIEYNPDLPIIVCLDFNIKPGTATLLQETTNFHHLTSLGGTIQYDEITIETSSNTKRVCDELLKHPSIAKHRGRIHFYGDATGGAGRTSATEGSDWEIVKAQFKHHYFDSNLLRFKVPDANPSVRAAINSLNARFKTADGKLHYKMHPRCMQTELDFRQVKMKNTFEIDKSDDNRTHWSDGIRYYVHQEFPIGVGINRKRIRTGYGG
jgi:hypothetical protein